MDKKIKTRSQLIRELIKTADKKLDDEELIHALLSQKMTALGSDEVQTTLGQRAADAVAKFAGSWAFIFSYLACMFIWMALNILMAANAFDAYPFILLNLVLSCVAAIQAPLIMMSQNRQEAKDRSRAENDYKVNLKNEIIIDDLHIKLDEILKNQKVLAAKFEALSAELDEIEESAKQRQPRA